MAQKLRWLKFINLNTRPKGLWTAAILLILTIGLLSLWLNYDDNFHNHKEYPIRLGGKDVRWGCFEFFSGIDSEPQVRVEYLLPGEFDPMVRDIVFYAPFANAKQSLKRPQLYPLATQKNMLLFTILFNYNIQKDLPGSEKCWDHGSGWFENVFSIQRELERRFNIPHKKLLVLGDSAGCRMAQQMACFFPDEIDAVAWCSGGGFIPYPSSTHPPSLALSAWGDASEPETMKLAAEDCARGGYTLFASIPPRWSDKGNAAYHHGGNDLGYNIMIEFLADVAALRRANAGNLPPVTTWPNVVRTADDVIMPSPGEAFSDEWNKFPDRELRKLREKEESQKDELLWLKLSYSNPNKVVIFLMPPAWRSDMWLIDNLFFIAERGNIAVSKPMINESDDYVAETSSVLKTVLADAQYSVLPIEIISCGTMATPLKYALRSLVPEEKKRISKVILMNPNALDEILLKEFLQLLVWSNDLKYKHLDSRQVIYRREPGETFSTFYYKMLGEAIE